MPQKSPKTGNVSRPGTAGDLPDLKRLYRKQLLIELNRSDHFGFGRTEPGVPCLGGASSFNPSNHVFNIYFVVNLILNLISQSNYSEAVQCTSLARKNTMKFS